MNGLLGDLRQYITDALPGGALNPEWTPSRVAAARDLAIGAMPVVGGGYGAVQEYREGNPWWAAMNAATVPMDLMTGGLLGTAVRGGIKSRKAALAMDDASRLARAQEQGYRTGLWRGGTTPNDGKYFTPDESAARDFGKRNHFERNGKMDVREYAIRGPMLGMGDILSAEDVSRFIPPLNERGYGNFAKYLPGIAADDYGGQMPVAAMHQMLDHWTGGNYAPIFKDAGYNAIDAGQEVVVLDPSVVRDAKKAAFDPARIGERDIYAGLAGPALGGLLGYSVYTDRRNDDSL